MPSTLTVDLDAFTFQTPQRYMYIYIQTEKQHRTWLDTIRSTCWVYGGSSSNEIPSTDTLHRHQSGRAWASPTLASQTVNFSYIIIYIMVINIWHQALWKTPVQWVARTFYQHASMMSCPLATSYRICMEQYKEPNNCLGLHRVTRNINRERQRLSLSTKHSKHYILYFCAVSLFCG